MIPRERHAVLALIWKAADREDLETIVGPKAGKGIRIGHRQLETGHHRFFTPLSIPIC
ncbi:hypothetical protein [Mesorhizobium sp. M1393]|uniref:hypothetical protein n=1 Tax=Mesorhizobium sp. M1393 TaxID=2957094 RepID=UPI003336CF8F